MKASRTLSRLATLLTTGLVAATLSAATAAAVAPAAATTWPKPAPSPVSVRVIAMNDFHGNLQPPAGSSGRVVLDDGTTVNAGGAVYIATWVKQLEAAVPHAFAISSGDNIGASPLVSALFHDEPSIEFLNDLGVSASAVGNHELDEGYTELRRMQFGGCHPTDGCQFRPNFSGATFPFLGANIYFRNGVPAVLPFTVKISGGIPIAIIGATLQDLPDVVLPSSIADLKFGDEVTAINRTSKLLDRLGIRSQVVVMHQGDESEGGGPNACNIEAGPATAIAEKVSPSVDAIFTGHTHQQYNCVIDDPAGNPRPMIQGLSFGRLLSVVDLKIDPRTRDVIRSATVANNVIVTREVTPDPTVQALVDLAVTKSAPIANRQVGTISADITTAAPPSGEQPLGDVIADAQLSATATSAGAQVAITNPGGIRTNLNYVSSAAGEGDGVVTYGEAFAVQPFSNIMQTITLTGAQLDAVLEQQWQPQADGSTIVRILQISSTLHYTQTVSQPIGSRISNITVNGAAVDPAATYRVSVNNFLAAGGDGFTVFAQGTNLTGGPIDLDAFTAYLTAHPNLGPPPADRITYVG